LDKVSTRTAHTKDALVMALMATAMFTVNLSHLMMTPLLSPLADDLDSSIAAVGQLVAATFLAWALTGVFIAPLSAMGDALCSSWGWVHWPSPVGFPPWPGTIPLC